jgi:hypothetical protein
MLTRLSLLVITGFLSCSALATDELQGASVADGDEYTLLADNRRKERRGERQDDRDDRQDCRQEEGRLGDDKRECKQLICGDYQRCSGTVVPVGKCVSSSASSR